MRGMSVSFNTIVLILIILIAAAVLIIFYASNFGIFPVSEADFRLACLKAYRSDPSIDLTVKIGDKTLGEICTSMGLDPSECRQRCLMEVRS
ncbi:MAG: hypothetical protein GXO63_03465 [Candidatus Micrarchaeota archaeon]|nr:hypothetical protein [Candidatus Micrarchaeota archaeon]